MADRAFWESRYAEPVFAYGTEPNRWVVASEPRLPRGARVLVPGDGEGRNGVYLARHGHDVTSLDMAASGLEKAAALASQAGLALTTLHADLSEWTPAPASYDAVVLVFLHLPPALRPRVHAALAAALRPGGVLVLEGFDRSHFGLPGGGPRDPAWLFDPAMLRADFAALECEMLEQADTVLDEGPYHQGAARVVHGAWRAPGGFSR